MKSDKIKLIVAIAIFVVAAIVIVYQMGLFSGGGSSNALPAPPPGEQPKGGPRAITPGK